MKSRKMIIAVLLFAAVAVSSATFAFWASGVTGDDDTATGTVTIGEGDAVTTTVNVADLGADGTLVPVGFTGTNNEDKDFTVVWAGSGAEGATGTLAVTVDSKSLGTLSASEIEGMFTINTSATPTITAGTDLTYTVNVEFTNEPTDLAMYNQVENGSLDIELTFTVTAD